MNLLRHFVLFAVVLALLGAAGGALFVWLGVYNVSALEQHTPPVYWLLQTAKERSIDQRAEELSAPDLTDPAWRQGGLLLYDRHCRQCHGAPGIPPEPFALGMRPIPTAIASIARRWQDRPEQTYWLIVNGIKMTGMPGWRYRLSEGQVWQLVAFLDELPSLGPAEYQARVEALGGEQAEPLGGQVISAAEAEPPLPGYPSDEPAHERGRKAIQQYGCTTCHRIPGLTAAVNDVGPPLAGIADRAFIAGILPNTPDNMLRWLLSPPAIAPRTAMPDMGLEEGDARDIAAYLATLRGEEGGRRSTGQGLAPPAPAR